MQVLTRGDPLQKARLISGLILFVFALTHFLNHAAGLISIETMHDVQRLRLLVTRSTIGSIVLGAALVTHIALALYKFATRATLKVKPWEAVQLGLGLLIPFVLFPHIVNTRVAHTSFGVEDNYLYELARLWPASAVLQSTLLVMVWVHGCLGLHFWLRLSAPYRAVQPVLLFIAIVVPLASLAGFMVAGRTVATLIEQPEMLAKVKDLTHWPDALASEKLESYRSLVRLSFAGVVAAIGGLLMLGHVRRLAAPKFTIRFVGGPTVKSSIGPTLLEISRANNIAHASVCGGRARCSTCRVRIDDTQIPLPPPEPHEAITLGSIQAPDNVRLACQIRPQGAMTVTRLLRARTTGPDAAEQQESDSGGVQKDLAVLYLNMRDFTALAQRKLPYDSVYILNTFFSAAGDAITSQGGRIEQFTGDGLFAVFGQQEGAEIGCRRALRAARAIDLALDHVNAVLSTETGKPMKIGIGLHVGSLLVGRIGYGDGVDLASIGPTMAIARHLDRVAKAQDVQIVATQDFAAVAGWDASAGIALSIEDPITQEPRQLFTIARGRDLSASILAKA